MSIEAAKHHVEADRMKMVDMIRSYVFEMASRICFVPAIFSGSFAPALMMSRATAG